MDRDALRALDDLLIGNKYSDEQLDELLPFVNLYLEGLPALRSLKVGELANGLVAVAGGRK
ncbi:MAG: hypothetical protein KC472_13000 [Dehalococcoidia bacterium]|nr:hypothetical protein [Dehalococcoidia bacterium]